MTWEWRRRLAPFAIALMAGCGGGGLRSTSVIENADRNTSWVSLSYCVGSEQALIALTEERWTECLGDGEVASAEATDSDVLDLVAQSAQRCTTDGYHHFPAEYCVRCPDDEVYFIGCSSGPNPTATSESSRTCRVVGDRGRSCP